MIILDFIRRASPRDLRLMMLLTMIAGIANAGLVVMVNQVAAVVASGARPGLIATALFLTAFALYYLCNRAALMRANVVIERLLRDLRLQTIDKLRCSELPTLERLGRGHLYNLISNETNHLSVAFPLIVDNVQQTVLLVVSLMYLAWLSEAAFIVFILSVGLGILFYQRINDDYRAPMALAQARQGVLLDMVGDIVDGFKEVRLNTERSRALRLAYQGASAAVEESRDAVGLHWAALILLSSLVTYFMLGIIGLVLPGYLSTHGQLVFQLVPTLLFCMGPLAKIVAQSPMFLQAEQGLRGILDVQRELDAAGAITPAEARAGAYLFQSFQRIAYRGLELTRRDEHGLVSFVAGPIDLTLNRGETVFLVGDNGSGKSTVLHLCTGLLQPDRGTILVDDRPVEGRDIAGFRELFACVFTDFHLFDRLYGMEHVDPARVQALLVEMELAHRVRFEDGRFSTTELSTGQRKRLGLIIALLEDRPIMVFDEWSAEQDAQFRAYFYATVLARLKAQGKTCLVVTHDERYLRHADRVVALDLGKVAWERPGTPLPPRRPRRPRRKRAADTGGAPA